jgi:hypothetical protein
MYFWWREQNSISQSNLITALFIQEVIHVRRHAYLASAMSIIHLNSVSELNGYLSKSKDKVSVRRPVWFPTTKSDLGLQVIDFHATWYVFAVGSYSFYGVWLLPKLTVECSRIIRVPLIRPI